MKKILVVSLFSIIASGCAISSHYVQSNSQTYTPTNPNNIKIYASPEVKEDYIVIGSIATITPDNGKEAVSALKSEAAKIGADAIIALELDKIDSYSQMTGASGVAIKFK